MVVVVNKKYLFDTEVEAYQCVVNRLQDEHNNAVAAEKRLREKLDTVLNHLKLLKDYTTNEQS